MWYLFEPLSSVTRAIDSSVIFNRAGINEATDGITKISEAISNYGVTAVLIGVFVVILLLCIMLIINIVNKISKKQDDYSTDDHKHINEFIEKAIKEHGKLDTETIKTIIDEFRVSLEPISSAVKDLQEDLQQRKENDENDYHKDIVGSFMNINLALRGAAHKAVKVANCDRIGIYVFHNGNSSVHGLPFFKMSCILDCNRSGRNTLRGKYQTDIPLQVFNDFIDNLYNDGYYKAGDIKEAIKEDPSILEFTSYSDTNALYIIGIKDCNDSLAGFIAAEFNVVQDFTKTEDVVREALDEMNKSVTPIITAYLQQRNAGKE